MKEMSFKLSTKVFAILLFGAFISMTAMTNSSGSKSKFFAVTSGESGEISKKVKATLFKAYKAQFPKAKLGIVKILPSKEGMNLWFEGASEGSPTFALELRMQEGKWGLLTNEPLGINNCKTSDTCSSCKIPCGCGRNGGGGSCVEVKTDKVLDDSWGNFARVLHE